MAVNPMIKVWATTTEREIQAEPFQRDERFLRGILPLHLLEPSDTHRTRLVLTAAPRRRG